MSTTAKTESAKGSADKTTQQTVPEAAPETAQRAGRPSTQHQLSTSRQRDPLALEAARAFSPFWLMRRLFESFERFSGMGRPDELLAQRGGGMFVPDVEVSRRGDQLVAQIDLPGLAPEDVHVSIDNGMLVIEGERHAEHENREGDVWTCERSYGRFQRAIPLPESADADSAEARFENGVLEVSVRAPEQQIRGKRIEVKSGGAPRTPPAITH